VLGLYVGKKEIPAVGFFVILPNGSGVNVWFHLVPELALTGRRASNTMDDGS